jgi:hypothetical protein
MVADVKETIPNGIWWCGLGTQGSSPVSNGGYLKQWSISTQSIYCGQSTWAYVPDMTSCGQSAMFGHFRIPIERVLPINPSGATQSQLVGSNGGSMSTTYTSVTLAQTALFDSRQNFIGTSFAVSWLPLAFEL